MEREEETDGRRKGTNEDGRGKNLKQGVQMKRERTGR